MTHAPRKIVDNHIANFAKLQIHTANSCEIAARISSVNELDGAMHNLSLNRKIEQGVTLARWGSRNVIDNQQRYNPQPGQYNAQQERWGPTC